jgi:hypothetical protein
VTRDCSSAGKNLQMLREAINQSYEACGTWKHGAPFLEGEVGGDDGGGFLVAPADNAVEEVHRARVDWHIPEFVTHQKIRVCVAFHSPFHGRQRLLFQEVCQRCSNVGEAHGHAGDQRRGARVLREHRLANSARSTKKDVLVALDEAKTADVLAQSAIDLARMAPIETIHGLVWPHGRLLRARGEIARLALPALDLDQMFCDLYRGQSALGCV